jgi:hypothetical protein
MGVSREDNRGRKRNPARAMCDHLFDTTTRYDSDGKLLTFLLFCPVCRTESVVETLAYEPSFRPREATMIGAPGQ